MPLLRLFPWSQGLPSCVAGSSASASSATATTAFSNDSNFNNKSSNRISERWSSELHGVLHRVSTADWVQIMATEGVGAGKSGYRVVEVEVTLYDGRRIRALTLEGQPPSLHPPTRSVSPSRRYLGLLGDGARHHGLNPEYITYLDSLQSYEANGWNNATGRAVVLAAAVPLALPLLPAVVLLRLTARKSKAREERQAVGSNGVGVKAGATAADCSTVAECVEAAAKGAAVATKEDPIDMLGSGAAKTTAVQMPLQSSSPPSVSVTATMATTQGSVPATVDSGGIPPQLLRPPMALPELLSGYLRAVQYTTWVVHDVLAATLLGSDSRAADAKQQRQG
ncbi:hypothetical protein VOLCADRAFT_99290 [Volvox carteri f. nagariensis]|uniref:gamma-glutamylcyclotransferase n=1 Tax=Volvox carteri f. nagariensis TaxID=3068 RepID=D8UHF5_VOLCA|nr:uncharacterized protein VOLCADRAFT_99290 [Volvox carteri f. nagariensis]EFJ40815.1 hypothetical protein VOLCADRAFT_99290 [Volvox carteri f. nagariensis]|eukprot:XP_002958084.1 hypothetical protein VOLCADRAFT_99290 [Volvox carteri f. nagariensis]